MTKIVAIGLVDVSSRVPHLTSEATTEPAAADSSGKGHFPRTFNFVKIPGFIVTDYNTIPDNRFLSISTFLEGQVGCVAVGGMAAHGLVNGMSGASPTRMSEANLPRPHLRRSHKPQFVRKHPPFSGQAVFS